MLKITSVSVELHITVYDDAGTDIDFSQAIQAATEHIAQQYPGETWQPVDVELTNYNQVRLCYHRPQNNQSDLAQIHAHYARLARAGYCCPPVLETA